jgi:hydrogenase-1 operon protein HyaF
MTEVPIPVRSLGAGLQPGDDADLHVLALPREMATFRMPSVPERAERMPLAAARDALALLLERVTRWDPDVDRCGPQVDLAALSPHARALTGQMLGEGEVSIRIEGSPPVRIQESVFTGIWQVATIATDGKLLADTVEAAALPRVVVERARASAAARLAPLAIPESAMNSPALLREIGAQMRTRKPGGRAHVVNLTLLPLTSDDHAVLEEALPIGPVALIARGFGNCRITSTLARDVWRVQYFNSMNTLILNTIEVVDIPEVALAAAEDLADSRVRLAELIAWMNESCDENEFERCGDRE